MTPEEVEADSVGQVPIAALVDIGHAVALLAEDNKRLEHLVVRARDEGSSWRMIGVAMGVSAQAAWERFRPPPPPRAPGGDPTLWED